MSTIKKMHKVYFRLSESEYQRLQRACKVSGVGNLSEFLRTVLEDIAGANQPGDYARRLRVLRARLKLLTVRAELLAQRMAAERHLTLSEREKDAAPLNGHFKTPVNGIGPQCSRADMTTGWPG